MTKATESYTLQLKKKIKNAELKVDDAVQKIAIHITAISLWKAEMLLLQDEDPKPQTSKP